jgi:hypothetical protein
VRDARPRRCGSAADSTSRLEQDWEMRNFQTNEHIDSGDIL